MKKIEIAAALVVVALSSALGVGRGTYVQDGLVAHWDGIDNAGTGVHDGEATVWKDLSPAGRYDLPLTANGIWGTDHLVVGGCSANFGAKGPEVLTVEFLLRHTTLTSKNGILFDAGHKNRLWVADANGGRYRFSSSYATKYLSLPYDASADHAISVAYSSLGKVGQIMLDGEDATSPDDVSNDTNTGSGFMIGDRATGATYPWYGKVYSARLYNRTLSAQEMWANQTVDAIRYFDAARTNAIVISGWPMEAGTPSVAYGPIAKSGDETSVTVSMPSTRLEGDVTIATPSGWKLYAVDPATRVRSLVSQSGAEDKFAVTVNYSETAMMELEWQWSVSNLVSIVTDDPAKGSVSVQNGWYAYGEPISVTATPATGYRFACWLGEIDPQYLTQASGTLPAVQPYALRASFVASAAPTADNVLYLSPTGDDSADGLTWATAKRTINAAHTAAAALTGSTAILVAPGIYPNTQTMVLSGPISICGITGNPEDAIFRLASGQTRFFWLDNAGARLEAITLEGGTGGGPNADSATANEGRGRNTYVTAGTVANCIFRGGELTSVTASRKRSTLVYLTGSDALMTHCVVTNNMMTGWGSSASGGYSTPGVVIDGGAKVEYSLIANNRDTSNRDKLQEAGGVTVLNGLMDHCTVVGNWAPNAGGVFLGANGMAADSVICGNYSTYNAATTDDIGGTTKNFSNCLFSIAPQSILANWRGGDYRSAAGTDAEGLGYANAPVGFIADRVEAFTAEEVVFAAQECAGATSYTWDFGDGSAPATGMDVTNAYANAGTYTVTLTVSTPDGAETVRKENFVYVVEPVTEVDAVADIQPAIDAQIPGGAVILAPGRYAVAQPISIWRDVRLLGQTGNPEDVVIEIAGADRAFHINSPGALVANLVSEGGTGTGWARNCYFEHRGGTMSNCVVRGCLLSGTFNANAFAHTVFMRGPDALLTHSVVTNNSSTCSGGSASSKAMVHGICLETGARVENTLVADNIDSGSRTSASAKNYATVYGNGAIRNCTIVNNTCSDVGGVRLSGGSIVDSVVIGNTSSGLAGEDNIHSGSASRASSCVTEGVVTALFKDWDGKDYHPVANTALVDAGEGTEDVLPAVDLDGNPRFQNGAVDIGCYELDVSRFDVTVSSESTAYLIPAKVNLSATVTGCADGDELHYYWDFDGDGVTDLEETANVPSNTVSHVYKECGTVSIGLAVTNFTGSVKGLSLFRPDFLVAMPPVIYFDPAAESSAPPYATWETAATNLQDAVDICFGGMTIIVRGGAYTIDETISIDAPVTVTGPESDPNALVFRSNGDTRMFYLNGGARLANCAFEGAAESRSVRKQGSVVYIAGGGGTVSNAILRGVSFNQGMNSSHYASPIYLDGPDALATHMVVTGNTCSVTGWATSSGINTLLAFDLRSGARVENTLMAFNSDTGSCKTGAASDGSGGEYTGGLVYGNGKLVNCTIVSNYCKSTSLVRLTGGAVVNTVMAMNAGESEEADPNLNDPAVALCDHSQIGGDPELLFRNPSRFDWMPRCRKGEDSLYDRGTEDGIELPAVDLMGKPRVYGPGIDIGCYENQLRPGLSIILR